MDEVQEGAHGSWHWREQPGAVGFSLPSRDFGNSALYQRGKANISSLKLGTELRLEASHPGLARVRNCTSLAVAGTEGHSQDGLRAIPFLKGSHCAGNRAVAVPPRVTHHSVPVPQEAGPTMVGDESSDPHLMSILGATKRTMPGNNL